MQVQRVDVVAGVAHAQPVAAALPYAEHWLHLLHRERDSVDGPDVEAIVRGVVLGKRHLNRFIRGPLGTRFAEARVIPMEWCRRQPNGLALAPGVLDDDAHAALAIVV